MRFSPRLGPMALLAAAASAQTAETPHFEVAEVDVSPHQVRPMTQGPFFTGGRYEVRQANMLDLIRMAYGVDPERVYGGPSWLEMDRFDVFGQTPGASNAPSRALMLQALLADRFHLVVHKDNKPMAAFALTVAKKPLLKEAEGSGETGCKFDFQQTPQPPPSPGGGPAAIALPTFVYTCHNTTMAAFASGLLEVPGAAQYFGNRPVVDRTGLQGAWDFTLKFTPKVPAGLTVTGESMPLFDAVERQLGLKLEASTAPMPVIMVDSVNEKPTPNPPDIAKTFPSPTEFEVAELKPSDPAASGGRGGEQRPEIKNGRVYVPRITLKNLVTLAWDLDSDEMLSGAPKWMDDDRFDLIAKAPPGVALGDLTPQRASVSVNIEALRPMLRSLIVDRFKLATHTEERPINTYTLTAVKPKLTKADSSSRTKWEEGVDPGSKNKNANPSLGRLVTCHNMTMAQFAQLLPGIAPGYLRTKVVDATGLDGGWDFTFSFSPAGVLQMAGGRGEGGGGGDGGGPPAAAAPEASEPSGGLSLFDAMVKQLGLKLEMQKRPLAVVVIDHVERKPIDN